MKHESSNTSRTDAFLRDLMPHASDEERIEARESLKRYIGIVLRIHERLERERAADSRESPKVDRFNDA